MSMEANFDKLDPKNIGRPYYWHLDEHIRAIVGMIRADEIQIALKMCDDIPAWYRENYPKELADIKNTLFKQLYDQFDYASDFDEANWNVRDIVSQCFTHYTYPRADILAHEIKRLNNLMSEPWIFEISPSHGWLPLGFENAGLKFSFFGKNLNQMALEKIKQNLKSTPWQELPLSTQEKILVCYESLEHMMNPQDLIQAAKKTGVVYDQIYLSTPKYCLGGGLPDWDTRRLGHVRGWTPHEFSTFAYEGFRSIGNYNWAYHDSHSMVLVGKLV